MRLRTSLMTSVGVVAGVAAAAVAYQSAAGASVASPSSSAAPQVAPAKTTTSWLPCEKGWKLEGQTCVRIKERVVVIHDRPTGSVSSWSASSSAGRPSWVPASVTANGRGSGVTTAPSEHHTVSPAPSYHEPETQQPEPSDASATPSAPGSGSDN